MSVEDIKAKGLKAWYVKDKKSGKYISNKYDCSYEYTDEPYIFCMSLDCLRNHLTKPQIPLPHLLGEDLLSIIID